jgi:isopentenyl-diphosphate Delta-isomerase
LPDKNQEPNQKVFSDSDPGSEARKKDHIELALHSQLHVEDLDPRFDYEPLLSSHPTTSSPPKIHFLDKELRAPLWVSSMTGGTKWAKTINHNLARAAHEFGFGMALGSCRRLLTDNTFLEDFDVRPILGPNLPLYGNLGIAQIEILLENNELYLIDALIQKIAIRRFGGPHQSHAGMVATRRKPHYEDAFAHPKASP